MKAPSSEPKGDSKMKRFFVFTLTALFVTTCLFLTNLIAENDMDTDFVFDGDVEVYTEVTTWFSFPLAKSVHQAAIHNNSNKSVRYYYTFKATVSGPEEIPAKEKSDHGWVAKNDSWYDSKNFSFNMRGRKEGKYTITAKADLTVKSDLNGDGDFEDPGEIDGVDSSCSTTFRIN